eukprot:GILK01004067.1.p1 GENE.GILK01004067.1~~GILK01004067.1.p1  ORF type:complete len:627 (-),score=65.92 GILK01004067.1:98-1945(-)
MAQWILWSFLFAVVSLCSWSVLALCVATIGLFWCWLRYSIVDEGKPVHRRNILNDRFEESKVPESLDVVVIGSGMSGLACAAVLSRLGYRVLVLEQHTIVGGGTHTFELGSGYQFDSGLHYAVPYCEQLLQAVCGKAKAPVIFDKMGETDGPNGSLSTFDKVIMGDDPTPFLIRHHEKHLEDIYRMFPQEKAAIDEFMSVTDTVLKGFPLWALTKFFSLPMQKKISELFLSKFLKYTGQTAEEVLTRLTPNKKLASLLCSLWIDTGSPPDRTTFMLNACVFRGLPHEGGAYPRGGSAEMSRALIPVIEAAGGRVLVRASVSQILMDADGKQAIGVRLANGMEIRSSLVVSSCGYHNTFGQLVDRATTERYQIPRQLPIANSAGFVMCNIGIEGRAEDLGITCANVWYHPGPGEGDEFDLFAGCQQFWQDPLGSDRHPPLMITFPSMKDRAWVEQHPTKHTCQLLVMAEHEWFQKWANQQSGKRGEEYEAVKEQWKQKCLKVLFAWYPKVESAIRYIDVSTPLSIEYYLREPSGGAVGLDHCPRRFVDWEVVKHLNMKTPIPGLYITGQDTLLCGQPIVLGAGIITALRIAGWLKGLRFVAMAAKTLLQSCSRTKT